MHTSRHLYAFIVFIFASFFPSLLYAVDEERLLNEIELLRTEYEQRLSQLEKELRELRVEREEATKVEPLPPKEEKFLPKRVLSLGDSSLEFYGFLRTDAIFDDSKADDAQKPFFIRSEDPRLSRPDGARKNDDQFTLHPRLTRFGVHFHGPEVAPLAKARLTGRLEVDFQNGGSESRQIMRLRHGYFKLTKNDWHLLAGQTSDIIAPLWPTANNDTLMWNAGNLGDRRPQIRLGYEPKVGKGRFSIVGGVGLTDAVTLKNLDASAVDNVRDGEDSGRPTLQFRAAYSRPLWIKEQEATLGLWAHQAWEESVTKFNRENQFQSQALGFDFTLPLLSMLSLKGEGWLGQDLDDVRGGIAQGINTSKGKEIHSHGGWMELSWKALPWYTFNTGYTLDNPDDGDLVSGARSKNQAFYVANRFPLGKFEIGADYLHWVTDYKRFEEGKDNRFNIFLQYNF